MTLEEPPPNLPLGGGFLIGERLSLSLPQFLDEPSGRAERLSLKPPPSSPNWGRFLIGERLSLRPPPVGGDWRGPRGGFESSLVSTCIFVIKIWSSQK